MAIKEKMIKLNIGLWTNGVPGGQPKSSWESGMIYLRVNKQHGLASDHEPFERLGEIPIGIRNILKRNGITTYPSLRKPRHKLPGE